MAERLNRPLICKIGLHTYLRPGPPEKIVNPPWGPFDPRTEEERTEWRMFQACAKCGHQREFYPQNPGDAR